MKEYKVFSSEGLAKKAKATNGSALQDDLGVKSRVRRRKMAID